MEPRRSMMQTNVPRVKGSKTQVMKKAGSEISLTPSQAVELEKQNAQKNPLDALSRMSVRNQPIGKRSGLQDVDEDYLKANVFTRPVFTRHSGLGDVGTVNAVGNQNYNSSPQMMTQGDAMYQAGALPMSEGVPPKLNPTQAQFKAGQPNAHGYVSAAGQIQPGLSQAQLAAQPAAGYTKPQVPAQPMYNTQQQGHQPPPANQAYYQNQAQGNMGGQYQQGGTMPAQGRHQVGPSSTQGRQQGGAAPNQVRQQGGVEPTQDRPNQQAQVQQANAQAQPPQAQGQTQNQQHAQAPNAIPAAEPEMCTTCPNCQTTIYLVRDAMSPPEAGAAPYDNAGQPPNN